MKQWISILLAVALIMSVLAGCSQQKDEETGAEVDVEPTIYYDITGIPQDAVVMTVGQTEIPAQLYFYWLSYMCSTLEYNILDAYNNYGLYGEYIDQETGLILWDVDYGDVPLIDFAREQTVQTVKYYVAIEELAQENGVELTQANLSDMEGTYRQAIEDMGGEDEFRSYLLMVGIDKEGFDRISAASYLYIDLLNEIYDPASDLYLADEDYNELAVYADHILLSTWDGETEEALSEEAIQEKYEQAQELLAQLRSADDPVALFAELADAYSEDTGREEYPDGYIYTEGSMVSEFEDAAKLLQPGEISDIVRSDYGFHIILRRDLLAALQEDESGKESIARAYLDDLLVEKRDATAVTFDEVLDSVDWENYYNAYAAKVDEIADANSTDPTE